MFNSMLPNNDQEIYFPSRSSEVLINHAILSVTFPRKIFPKCEGSCVQQVEALVN